MPANGITTSPNMNLPIPATGVTPGPEWFQAIVQALTLIDQHNHSTGEGVPIGSNGINLTADLSLSDYSLIAVANVQFTAGTSALLNALYVNGVDLYYNDGNGNTVQITSGGTVNATSSGITSGTATASFVASVLVVNAAANTPANIRGASILIGNNVANSKYVTLSPPNSLAADYQLFLPATLPASTLFMTLDSSGNIAAASNASLAAALPAGSVTRAQIESPGQQVSTSCGAFTYTYSGSSAFSAVTNLSVTITTSGKPVWVGMVPDGTSSTCAVGLSGGSAGSIRFAKGGVNIGVFALSSSTSVNLPASAYSTLDVVVAGTYTYTVQVALPTTGSMYINACKLVAYELL